MKTKIHLFVCSTANCTLISAGLNSVTALKITLYQETNGQWMSAIMSKIFINRSK